MAGIYIYSDQKHIAGELITFAKSLNKPTYALTFSPAAAEEIKSFGADQIYVLKGDSPLVENYAKAIAELLSKEAAELFLVGGSARGRDLAARVAGYLDCAMISDASALSYADGKVSSERNMYGGSVVQSEVAEGLSVVTIPAGKFAAVAGGTSEIITIEIKADTRVSLLKSAPIEQEGADLAVADKVVCVGLGLDQEADMQIAKDLAAVLGAEIGCTRGIAEERHWLPVSKYIGISGATIKPRLYISMGVSGQVQHLVGVRDAKIIVAVDSNENAPIFKAADYGIVGDLYEIVPLLTKALKNTP